MKFPVSRTVVPKWNPSSNLEPKERQLLEILIADII